MVRLYLKKYRFCRIERYVGAYRHHPQQVTTVATGDSRANACRLEERSRVYRKYRSSNGLRTLVDAYDTFHQRRVKVLGAWRRGGAGQVLKATSDRIRRQGGGKPA